MTMIAVEIVSFAPADRPQTVAGIMAALAKLPGDAVVAVETDGTLRVVTYREVTPAEKLGAFLSANPDITSKDIVAAAGMASAAVGKQIDAATVDAER